MTLSNYDADNETFLLDPYPLKEFVLPVPIDKAPSFKANFNPNNFTNVDFVKIDVEHFELQVCKGAENTFKKYMPTIMFENKRNEARDCKDFLESIGYQTKMFKSDTVAYTLNR